MEKPAKEAEKYLDLDTGNEEEKKKSNEEGRSINESFSFSESVITVKSSSTLSIGAADEEQAKRKPLIILIQCMMFIQKGIKKVRLLLK